MRLVQEAREQDPELSVNAAVQRIGTRVRVNPDPFVGGHEKLPGDGHEAARWRS